jgi:threonine dehydrogenase-like Zn-dependent dehydrogenase
LITHEAAAFRIRDAAAVFPTFVHSPAIALILPPGRYPLRHFFCPIAKEHGPQITCAAGEGERPMKASPGHVKAPDRRKTASASFKRNFGTCLGLVWQRRSCRLHSSTRRSIAGTASQCRRPRAWPCAQTERAPWEIRMRALVWHGTADIRCDTVADPEIEDDGDAIVKVTTCAICGSDLHLYDHFMPGMHKGFIVGHEFMGEVVETGKGVSKLKKGDRVVVPFTITCGQCDQCRRGNFSLCEVSNRNKDLQAKLFGHHTAGFFGYTELTGGYAGGQAEYVRVPFADATHVKVPNGISDEKVLFLGDIFPTGWQAVVQCDIEPTDTVAIWGCGPVGQMAVRSAVLLGARQVIAIDRVPERLDMARAGGATTINFADESVIERLNEMTGGKGPEKCIDCVGLEAHVTGHLDSMMDRAKQALMLETDRPHVLREMIYVCRPGGTLSIPGVYGGLLDKIPFGASMNKGLTWRMGQTHVNRWTGDLLRRIEDGEIDPSFVITHTEPLEKGPEMYRTFRDKEDGCVKVVLKP